MIKNYLLITFRSMLKNKVFLSINIVGMAIAIACCIVAYFNYDFNASFDSHHAQSATIYRVNSVREFQGEQTTYGYVPIALGNAIMQNVPDVNAVVRYQPNGGNFRIGDNIFNNEVANVDPAFFNIFSFEFIEGNEALTNKAQLCIREDLAEKYFGTVHALGKAVTQVLDSGKTREFVVSGVYRRQPDNSSFDSRAFSRFENAFGTDPGYQENSWRFRSTLFVQVKDPSRLASIREQLLPYTENNNKIREDFIIRSFALQPFAGMAVSDQYDNRSGTWTRDASPLAAVAGVGVMAIFVLLISCFNLTNTAVAISSGRLKEIGIRKVMGSTRKHLVFQFLGETTLTCLLALVLGLLMGEYLLVPAFNKLWPELKLTTNYFDQPDFLLFIGGTLIFTSLLAGSYPALYVSKFQPTTILKGKLKFGGTNYFTRFLLTMQFAISLIGIVCSFAFLDNAKFQREFDLGFNKEGVVFTYINNRSEFETYRNELHENPDIISIAGSQHHIFSSRINDPIKHAEKEIEVDILNIGEDYVPTVGLTLTEGRNFVKDSETDRKESVLVTEGLVRELGLRDPIGKEILWMDTVRYYVVGVVRDIYTQGLWEKMEPVMFRYGDRDNVNHILVRAPAEKIKAVNTFMEAKWKVLFPNRLYNGRYMDEEIVEANTVNNNIVIMFVFLGIVALLLSATGLFTLVSLNIIKKMKEIGVRKVLGASVSNITRVINTEFVIILMVASVLGGFMGAYMAEMLMKNIWKYYLDATWLTLVLSAAILFVASALSIGYKVYNTSRLNPADVLRDE
ncbi:MAG: FtsX-like permease family protein [Cytophagales bacterium]|nr:FtsX-like permease family protein [Cytophagales bacterium]